MTGFKPGDTVSFTYRGEQEHWIVGEVEEIRKGYEGDHLLVVRQGGPWSGDRYVVLSSYTDKVASSHAFPYRSSGIGKAIHEGMTTSPKLN